MKPIIQSIDDALDKIYSYVDYSMTHAEEISSAVFSLERIRNLLSKLDNPQDQYQTVHVAGTKGKGSVCSMIYQVLCACGYRTGIYTSPHLIRFNERIQVDGKMISDRDLIRLTEEVTSVIDPLYPPSSFDLMTAIAFKYFQEKKVDFAVIETGLGGRLDSTNVITPLISVITSISLDHVNFLGNTIEAIAAEKAGIIKPGVPIIAAAEHPAAMAVLRKTASERNAEWIDVESQYGSIPADDSDRGQTLMIWQRSEQLKLSRYLTAGEETDWKPWLLRIPMAGLHQSKNAATALAALIRLKPLADKITEENIEKGFSETFLPCRFEIVSEQPLIVLDGAHNQDSMRNLAATINRYYGTRQITCVIGCSEDKDLAAMLKEIAPLVQEFVATRSTHPRSMDPNKILEQVLACGRRGQVCEKLEDALEVIQNRPADCVYIVTGSLFVTAGFRELMMKSHPEIRYFAGDE